MKKKNGFCIVTIILLIAAWLDLEYKGLFYKMLPEKLQSTVDDYTVLNKK